MQTQLEKEQRNLQAMKASQGNRLKRFGQHMPQIVQAIENYCQQGRFHKKPIGPLGKIYFHISRKFYSRSKYFWMKRLAQTNEPYFLSYMYMISMPAFRQNKKEVTERSAVPNIQNSYLFPGVCFTLTEQKWALAVECCLKGLMTSFCCHDFHDEKVFDQLVKSVCGNSYKPTVIVSSFKVTHVFCIHSTNSEFLFPVIIDQGQFL